MNNKGYKLIPTSPFCKESVDFKLEEELKETLLGKKKLGRNGKFLDYKPSQERKKVFCLCLIFLILLRLPTMSIGQHTSGYSTNPIIAVHSLHTGPHGLHHQDDTTAKEEGARSFPVHF